ncbi:hypothetical protein [Halococcus salifodinae]|uniref:Luciferase-like monooxygenase n=1 Tax=Halococcus salifodinae DSM 8989 TaxID=1227456 RepID=M0NCL3_9EURY|nr:hypothetical protein [Halococcus salifodinae]EMA54415.1 hypothetical protein C450_06290 [Halococcus salifodinae DSM 8989]
MKRRLQHADGWIAPPQSVDTLAAEWASFADYLESTGRDPDAVDKVALQYLHLEPTTDGVEARRKQRNVYGGIVGEARTVEEASESWLSGSVDDVKATLSAYEADRFDEVILHPLATDPAELDRQLRLYRDHLLPEYP